MWVCAEPLGPPEVEGSPGKERGPGWTDCGVLCVGHRQETGGPGEPGRVGCIVSLDESTVCCLGPLRWLTEG